MSLWRQAWTLFLKDLRIEMRTREVLYSSLLFALVLVVVFLFSGFEGEQVVNYAAPSVLWVSLAFVGTIVFTRTFQREREGNAISALLLVPDVVDALYVAKLMGNVLFLAVVELMMVPLVFMTFRVDATAAALPIVGVMALGTVGYCALGTVLSAALAAVKLREVILPIALFPLTIPLLVAGVKATFHLLYPETGEVWDWIKLMIAFDVIFLVLSRWLFAEAVDSGAE